MAALILSLILMTLALVIEQTAPHHLPWLHVQGNRIVDENGLPVILRGVAIEDQCYTITFGGHRFNESDIVELVQNWRVNVIRLPILPEGWQNQSQPDSHCSNYLHSVIDPIVDLADKYGVYVLLGYHAHGNPITGETNAPYMNPSMSLATDFWNATAEHYKNDSWVIYSIFDEPFSITWNDWEPFAQQLVDTIHSHNSKALTLVSGVDWAYDLREVKNATLNGKNIVYEVHPYPRPDIGMGTLIWDRYFGYLTSVYPLFAGEWGFIPGGTDAGGTDLTLNATATGYGHPLLEYMAGKNISWTAFCWSNIWSPAMLKSQYVPTEYGQFVKDALTERSQVQESSLLLSSSVTSTPPALLIIAAIMGSTLDRQHTCRSHPYRLHYRC